MKHLFHSALLVSAIALISGLARCDSRQGAELSYAYQPTDLEDLKDLDVRTPAQNNDTRQLAATPSADSKPVPTVAMQAQAPAIAVPQLSTTTSLSQASVPAAQ